VLAEHFKRADRDFELARRDLLSFVWVVFSEKLLERFRLLTELLF
jgi:hypothetical protein